MKEETMKEALSLLQEYKKLTSLIVRHVTITSLKYEVVICHASSNDIAWNLKKPKEFYLPILEKEAAEMKDRLIALGVTLDDDPIMPIKLKVVK